tara:strand:- start:5 stop:502 length:498 start_codon:yes stop_codon:yes gene_type:complete
MDLSQFILPEFPDYLIYPTGEVYSIRGKKYLKPRYDKNGYKRIDIKNILLNKIQTLKLHQLVAMKYLNHTMNTGLVVDHINNNKLDNAVHNLQLLTSLNNTLKYFHTKIQKNGLPSCIYYKAKKNVYIFKLSTTDCNYNIECTSLLDCINVKNEIFKKTIKGKLD